MKKEGLIQSNKGFTLAELCVIMVLISVLASVTTFSLIAWQHDSVYNKEVLNAEIVYMAMKNKIAIYKANGAIDDLTWWVEYNPEDNINEREDDRLEMSKREGYRYIMCKKDDYDAYLTGNTENIEDSAPIVYDIVSQYIKDKNILRASICVEVDNDGNIIAVFYSDRVGYFSCKTTSQEDPNCIRITNLKNKPDTCYEKLVGLYMPD